VIRAKIIVSRLMLTINNG